MNKDQWTGAAQDVAGKLQQTAGMATGSAETRMRGVGREIVGKAQYAYGEAREAADDIVERTSEVIDRVQDELDDAVRRSGEVIQRTERGLHRGSALIEKQAGQYPLASLLAVGITGFVAGLVIKSLRSA